MYCTLNAVHAENARNGSKGPQRISRKEAADIPEVVYTMA